MNERAMCRHCERRGVSAGERGLCRTCYRDPEIRMDYPRGFRTSAETVEEAEFLVESGASLSGALEQMEVERETLRRALSRAGRSDLYWALADRMPDAVRRRAGERAVA